MPAKNYFRCRICGDIHYGAAGPEVCPTCRQKNTYDSVDIVEAKKSLKL